MVKYNTYPLNYINLWKSFYFISLYYIFHKPIFFSRHNSINFPPFSFTPETPNLPIKASRYLSYIQLPVLSIYLHKIPYTTKFITSSSLRSWCIYTIITLHQSLITLSCTFSILGIPYLTSLTYLRIHLLKNTATSSLALPHI